MQTRSITAPIVNSNFGRYISKKSKAVHQKVLDILPSHDFKSKTYTDNMGKISDKLSSAEQRLILGATALMFQPFIDLNNKKVDNETRKVSVARTISKIVVGTATGYFIRKGCIKGIAAFSKAPGEGVSKLRTIFTPKNITDVTSREFAQYRNAFGTVAALVTMMFTNFLVDAPLTKFFTNLLVSKSGGKNETSK